MSLSALQYVIMKTTCKGHLPGPSQSLTHTIATVGKLVVCEYGTEMPGFMFLPLVQPKGCSLFLLPNMQPPGWQRGSHNCRGGLTTNTSRSQQTEELYVLLIDNQGREK